MVISQVVPVRIAQDYKKLVLFSDSPLLEYMPYLNETKGFHLFVAKLVGITIKIYDIFRRIRNKTKLSKNFNPLKGTYLFLKNQDLDNTYKDDF